jgi:DNA topoisomerase-1
LKIGERTVKTGNFDQEAKKSEVLIGTDAQAAEIVAEANKQTYTVTDVATKERKRNPVPPFITSKLQQEAARKLGYAVKKTMIVAQKLYEESNSARKAPSDSSHTCARIRRAFRMLR